MGINYCTLPQPKKINPVPLHLVVKALRNSTWANSRVTPIVVIYYYKRNTRTVLNCLYEAPSYDICNAFIFFKFQTYNRIYKFSKQFTIVLPYLNMLLSLLQMEVFFVIFFNYHLRLRKTL